MEVVKLALPVGPAVDFGDPGIVAILRLVRLAEPGIAVGLPAAG